MILLYIMKWCEFLVCLWFAEQGGLVCGRVVLALVDGVLHGFDAGLLYFNSYLDEIRGTARKLGVPYLNCSWLKVQR